MVGDRVLPHSEIVWALPDGLPHIVTYAAKWETGSVYDRGTVPRLARAPRKRGSSRAPRPPGPARLGRGGGRRLRAGSTSAWTSAAAST